MDKALSEVDQEAGAPGGAAAGMPPERPGPMPSQPLASWDPAARRAPVRARDARAPWRRLAVLGTSVVLAGLAANEMRVALSVGHLTVLSVLVLVLFTLNVTWISFPFVVSLVGLLRSVGRRPRASAGGPPLSSRTAVLMPTHNEDPARVAAALEAMARDVVARGEGRSFDLFLLSDTTLGDVALREEEAVLALRRRLGDAIRVYYRRRAENTAHKSGNVRDFCERWGGAYDHLLMLDADSLMDGGAIVGLARRMEDDPGAGLIQTLPRLHRGTTLLARVQQFAARVYGTLLGEGLAWWAGTEASFWGHNAILRTRAFMECAGLPVLPGSPPFGGPILSHDFVEAALIRRGGWSVSIAPELEGSYEECPTSLIDLAVRDRRWCQGNLQHARVLRARGLHWVSRLHLVAGIMSYLSSPLWLLFVIATLALGVQYEYARLQYFSHAPTLFPLWPRIDPARAVRLFGFTMGILFAPKWMGLLSVLLRPRRVRQSGGLARLSLGFLLELTVSALLAPIQGLIHTGLVADVLRGRDSGWRAQRREGEGVPWSEAFSRHVFHMVAGVAFGVVAWGISWQMLAWLSPAVAGMVLAAPLSKLTASPAMGRRLARLGLLRTPEETRVPAIARAADAALPHYQAAVARAPRLADLVRDPDLLARHLALTDRALSRPRGHVSPIEAVAEKKIREAVDLEEATAVLTPGEQARVQALPALLRLLAELIPEEERPPAEASVPGRRLPDGEGPWQEA